MAKSIDTQNKQQLQAFDLIANTNTTFFLTGRAGTGKTTFLKKVREEVQKNFLVLAPTGIAAINAGGQTIHSFFGFPFSAIPTGQRGSLSPLKQSILRHIDTIIIDEVSMVRCDIIDAIDNTLRYYTKLNIPFGGKQVVFIGDMFQLAPIVSHEADRECIEDFYGEGEPYFYKAKAFNGMQLCKIEFQKVYRQQNLEFLNVLDRIREGNQTYADLTYLNSRMVDINKMPKNTITLCSRNNVAQDINNSQLAKIANKSYFYEATIEGNMRAEDVPVEQALELKVGAQIMMCKNDVFKRWVNGSLGTVVELDENTIKVQIEDRNDVCTVEREIWEKVKHVYNREHKTIETEVEGRFAQYPIKLAWAITIHKSQGLTFNSMCLDLSSGIFAKGQLYVALSRVRSLDGLWLTREVNRYHIKPFDDVNEFARTYNNEEVINNYLNIGKKLFPLEQKKDYDGMVVMIMELLNEAILEGAAEVDIVYLMRKLFATMLDDECLFGLTEDTPLLPENFTGSNLLNALICLYAKRYEDAIYYADQALEEEKTKEAYYIKARAYNKLGKHKLADAECDKIGDLLKGDIELLYYYYIGKHNELYVKDPGINLLLRVLYNRRKYFPNVLLLRECALNKKIKAKLENDEEIPENVLFKAFFNKKLSADKFAELLDKEAANAETYIQFTDLLLAVKWG